MLPSDDADTSDFQVSEQELQLQIEAGLHMKLQLIV